MAKLLRAADCRRMKWKNGGGETIEIAIHPAGSGLDDFDWRVSMARVEADGPFSIFPGVDRTLAVLEGEGIVLEVGGETAALTTASVPLTFPADVATTASLIAGPITDLNVMGRRGRCIHSVAGFAVSEPVELAATGDATLLLCQTGSARGTVDGDTFQIGRFDALLVETGRKIALEAKEPALFLEVEIRRSSQP